VFTTTRIHQGHKATQRGAQLCNEPRFARQQDVNLVKIRVLENQTAQLLATFWIVIAAKTNAIKKRVNPFTRLVFDHSAVRKGLKLNSIKHGEKPP
jgi:hypothetical protein